MVTNQNVVIPTIHDNRKVLNCPSVADNCKL